MGNEPRPPAGTRFGLMRHAQTVWNRRKRIQGQQDSPLTARGERSARAWGRRLRGRGWRRILCSDTGRAVATARLINETLGLPLATDARLREQEWGRWTGLTVAEATLRFSRTPSPPAESGWGFRPPGGESREEMWERGQKALVDAAARWPGSAVLVVSHGGMLRCLVNRLLGLRFTASEPRVLLPAHLHLVRCGDGGLALETVNALDLDDGGPSAGKG